MLRLHRASAIVALDLLTSAATAYAECAWVLWTRVDAGGRPFDLVVCLLEDYAGRPKPKATSSGAGTGTRSVALGSRPWSQQASRTFGSTTCATRSPPGSSSAAAL